LLTGAAGVAAARGLATAWPGAIALAKPKAKPCVTRAAGVRRMALTATPDGRTLWTADPDAQAITAHRVRDLAPRRSIAVGGAAVDLAIAGTTAVVALGFYGPKTLAVVDLVTRRVSHHAVGDDVRAVRVSRDGRTAYVAGGGAKGWLRGFDTVTGEAGPQLHLGRHPRSLALSPDGRHALVALNGDAAVAVIALRDLAVVQRIATREFPYLVAWSPEGDRGVVSHNGYGADHVTIVDPGARRASHTLATHLDPAGVAFVGRRSVLVAERGAGTLALLDSHSGRRRRRLTVGGRPRSVIVRGRRAFAVDGETGQLTKVEV
jgi:DNA-binding beta-propeller fold protein YncE